MEDALAQPERRSQPRYAVDEDVSVVIVSHGATIRGCIFEISLDGCRIRTDRSYSITTPAGIELMFKINGIAFRLDGVLQWADSQQIAGIQFGSMAPRRRDTLLELLAELEADEQARAAKEADGVAEESDVVQEAASPEATQGLNRVAAVLKQPGSPLAGSLSGGIETRQPALAMPLHGLQRVEATAVSTQKLPTQPSGDHLTIAKPPAEPSAQVPPPSPTRGRERRTQARHSVDTRATVFFIDVRAQITGRILDLSMSGCRIRTDERFPVGIYRRVETEFKVDGLPFRLGGVVQSLHDKFTVGIRFLDLSPRKRDQLAQLMEEIEEMHQVSSAYAEAREVGSI